MSKDFDLLYGELQGLPKEGDPEHWNQFERRAQGLITAARTSNDPQLANRAWHLSAVASARATMSRTFLAMQEGKFRTAWPDLERIEKITEAIERNAILSDDFAIGQLRRVVTDWQSLYPYTVFASPEIVIRQQECTICGVLVSPLRACNHRPGYVYEGAMCVRKVTKADIISIAMVRDPVQKYSVIIPNPDPHDYAQVKFVVDRLYGPFSRWRLSRTKILREHSYFSGWDTSGNCPCHSGFRYDQCCLPKAGIHVPHLRIEFEDQPPPHLPEELFCRRTHASGCLETLEICNDKEGP